MASIFVAGQNGMVGSALVQFLKADRSNQIIDAPRNQLDLSDQKAVRDFFRKNDIEQVYFAAAKVGGIHANMTYPADFIYQNLIIQNNIIQSAFEFDVKRLMFLGSSCIYPRQSLQPISEQYLLTGELEPTNEPYAIAKIAGIKMCQAYRRQYGVDFRSVMPTNLYGPRDNFHPMNSHVIPAMLLRFHQAKIEGKAEVVVWGSGAPRREFMYVDDMAAACVHIMGLTQDTYEQVTTGVSHLNIGTGEDCSIAELAQTMKKVIGYRGDIVFDETKPDGMPRKLLDTTRLKGTGWQFGVELDEGLAETYNWMIENWQQLKQT